MPDRTKIIPIPLTPGIQEGIDRGEAPLGTLIAAVNARWRKGGIGKANGVVTAGTTTQAGGFGSGYEGLGFAAGRQVALNDGRVWVRRATGEAWKEIGRSSRYLPVKTHWIAFDESSDSLAHPTVAVINTTIAVAYTRYGTIDTAVLSLMNTDGTVRDTAIISDGMRGGVVAVGGNFAFVYTDSVGAIKMLSVLATSNTIDTSGAVQVGSSAALLAADAAIDVAPYSSTHLLVAWRVSNTAISVSRVAVATGAITSFQNATCANTALSSISVFGTAAEPIWMVHDEGGSNGLQITQFSADLASTLSGPSAFSDGQGAGGGYGYRVGMCRVSSNSARLCWRETLNTASTPTFILRSGSVDGTVVSKDTRASNMLPASAPFAAEPHLASDGSPSGAGSYSVLMHTDSGSPFQTSAYGAWTLNRRYVLTTPSTHNDSLTFVAASQYVTGVELSPDDRATVLQSAYAPRVAERSQADTSQDGYGGTRYYLPAMVVLRTQDASDSGGGLEPTRTAESSAIVIYEVEGYTGSVFSDGRARGVVEVGGRTLVLGGHVQEPHHQAPNALRVYSSGGTERRAKLSEENGFAFAPAILRAAASAGGSLTADQRYFFCATYEYITPDGLRVKSAPSNIVSVQPTGANLQVDLTISGGPFTEREIISPVNRAVVHVYATTASGNVFQRVTPDAAGYLAVPGAGSGGDRIAYTHSVADTVIQDNEALYTDLGELPNAMSPAHRFGWAGGGRVVLAGLFDPTLIEMSKPPRANQPVEFTRAAQFRTQLPNAVTGGAFLDNAHVIFTRTGIYLLSGEYPDATGAPSLRTPQKLPSNVGCIDWRSVCEVQEGLVFQSERGIEILPRGFGAPQLISGPVQDSLRGYRVISAVATAYPGIRAPLGSKAGERLLVCSIAVPGVDGYRLIYDLDAQRWISVDTPITSSLGEYLAVWDGKLAVAPRALNTLFYEAPDQWATGTVSLTTADARPFAGGRGHVHRFQLTGEFRTTVNTTIRLQVYLDGAYSTPVDLGNAVVLGATVGDKFIAEWAMRGAEKKVQAIGATLTVTGASNSTEDIVINGLTAEVSGLAGRQRVRQNRRAV